ncbi:MAG: cell division protein SepF [Ruminococcus sp.]|nr:cell division protein SepF [Ruminococcus sp.]
MAGFVDKFKRMWDAPDDEYEYDEYGYDDQDEEEEEVKSTRSSRKYDDFDDYGDQPVREHSRRSKVVNISTTAKLRVALFKPEKFGEETRTIADELVKTHTVVLNLEHTNKDMARRIIDFLSGVAYANRGKIKKVSANTFIIIPNNVDLTGDDLLDELEHNGLYL